MPKSKMPVLTSASQHQRKRARRSIGKLSSSVVSDATHQRYLYAIQSFFSYLDQFRLRLAKDLLAFDEQLCAYLDYS